MPTVQVEGLGAVNFPEGTSEADMTRSVQDALTQKNAPQPLSGPIAPPSDPITGDSHAAHQIQNQASLWEGLKGAAKGALSTAQDASHMVFPRGSFMDTGDVANTTASNPDQVAGKVVEGALELGAGLPAIADAAPSAARAGQVFDSIAKDAAQTPVNLSRSGDTLLELHDLGATGSNLPKAVRQLTNRATAPGGADILYPEARKFASRISNSSIAERLTSDPNLKRVLGGLREGFNADVGDAANAVGRGQDYEQALKEYAQAKKLQRVGVAAGTGVASGLGVGAKLGALGHILKAGH